MKIFKILFSIICIFLTSIGIFAQEKDTLMSKARNYIENREPSLAIPLLKKYSTQFPEEFLSYELTGDCFLAINSFQEAIKCYLKGLNLNPDLARLYYKLGNAYDIIEKPDSAIYFFRKFLSSDPSSVNGNLRLSVIFLNLPSKASDSCLFYARRALEIEPQNQRAQNILAMSYFSLGDYDLARKSALDGLNRDSIEVNLLQTVGQCSFILKEYDTALKYFDKAIKVSPENTLLRDYKAQSLIMKNTNPDKVFYNGQGRVKFIMINSENITKNEKELTKPFGAYNYTNLLKKYRDNPATMGLDEFFMLYYGYSNQPEYSPYKVIDEELNKMLDIDLKKSAEIAENLAVEYPTNFPLYLTLAGIYKQLGDYRKYSYNILRYLGFLESIKATGEGTSPSSAYIITHTSHENEIAFNLGYAITMQKLISEKGHNYDVISCKENKGKEVSIYFNIDKPYSSLLKSLPGKNKNLKRKVR